MHTHIIVCFDLVILSHVVFCQQPTKTLPILEQTLKWSSWSLRIAQNENTDERDSEQGLYFQLRLPINLYLRDSLILNLIRQKLESGTCQNTTEYFIF